ncbi:MAG: hypothetical protein OEZ68_14015 [Gammaproteobacteria bacterium]|nr:hypothetical protein [Gammaproteobacteria bacterium]MDH5801918.1 hypothetical protein [Gammaproteobacteria bacterium]
MNDTPNNSNHDDHNDTERRLSELYRLTSREQPSAQLDDAILKRAQAEAKSIKSNSPFGSHWSIPMSMAAVLVLSVSILLTIDRESPQLIDRSPEPLPLETFNEPVSPSADPSVAKTVTSQPSQHLMPHTTPGPDDSPSTEENQTFHTETQQDKQSGIMQADNLEQTPHAEMAKSKQAAKQKPAKDSDVTAASPPALSLKIPHAAESKKRASTQASERREKALTRSYVPGEPHTPELSRSREAKQDSMGLTPQTSAQPTAPIPRVTAPTSMLESESAPMAAESFVAENPASALELTSTESMTPAPAPAPATPQTQTQTQAFAAANGCHRLSQSACLNSDRCVLEQTNPRSYRCRAAGNHCELNFFQDLDEAASCETKPGCEFVKARCYCAPGKTCSCTGGTPALCRAKKSQVKKKE